MAMCGQTLTVGAHVTPLGFGGLPVNASAA
jgi:hypothetical protein